MLGRFQRILLLTFIWLIIVSESLQDELFKKTLHVHHEDSNTNGKTMIFSAADDDRMRFKRAAKDDEEISKNIYVKSNHLNDTHKQLMVHWVGNGSNVIICLARDPSQMYPSSLSAKQLEPSSVYISYDYGETYVNKTNLFNLPNNRTSTVEKFFNHPRNNSHFIFNDVQNQYLFLTRDYGRTIQRIKLTFTPHDVSFHYYDQNIFLVFDKSQPKHTLWMTKDFGKTWTRLEQYVKSFYWIENDMGEEELIVQRMEPDELSVIIKVNYHLQASTVLENEVKELYMKGDYFFYTKKSTKNNDDLYVSYKFQSSRLCLFDTELDRRHYYIADVTDNRAFVAVGHSDAVSHLYVSRSLKDAKPGENEIQFVLSLENVLCYFPNNTWIDSWLHHTTEEAFADFYRVEGISGIYIVSQVVVKVTSHLGPQHLASRITFNHGGTWHPLKVPEFDNEGQEIACQPTNNCSLHLSQRFNQLYPDTKSMTILSSKSAPGIIIATGVIGKSLKGHFGVYLSTDAGLTWRQALKELYFFNMADYGGILAAVKYFKKNGETKHILYSTDAGANWTKAVFHSEHIKLYGLMTEPGENTTIFTMFGSAPDEHQWIIIKIDMMKAFSYNCTDHDYKHWIPSQMDDSGTYIPCVLGKSQVYRRKVPKSNCFSGKLYGNTQVKQFCSCRAIDYECDIGFISTGNPPHCVRNKTTIINPYEVPSNCKPGDYYYRTKGYRKIIDDVCVNGDRQYYEPDRIPCPFDKVPEFLLFAQHDKIARYDLETQVIEELPIDELRSVVAIDFDMHANCVYWSDVIKDTISRQCLNNGTAKEVLVSNDLSSVEGMALDWISHTLYFVDGVRAKIELIRTDVNHAGRMRKTILDQKVLKQPRGIAVDPVHGYMFWTDWAKTKPTVNRADLDGQNIKQLFRSPTVEWPNGITIDHIQSRVYWTDASKDYIASSDFDGGRFKIIIENKKFITHPFAIAVFKDTMYWDDWNESSIFSADKDNGLEINQLAKKLSSLMNLKVYAHSLQEGVNDCTNMTGPFICVGTPKGRSFLCPDEMEYKDGKCICPGGAPTNKNMTCQKVQKTCSATQFTCGDGDCVSKRWICDGQDDCRDRSDELNCNQNQTCHKNFFACADGKCIPEHWRCDNEVDCINRTDEIDCPHQPCNATTQFACRSGQCISIRFKCDGEIDCIDASDEEDCFNNPPKICTDEEFKCEGGKSHCIPLTWKCDGESDCADNSDEMNCGNKTCTGYQFDCGPPAHKCIYAAYVCDGDNDCVDGSDEKNCTTKPVLPPEVSPFNKTTDMHCGAWMFKCATGVCIPMWWKCDMSDDCGDGSDEIGCKKPSTTTDTSVTNPPQPHVCSQNQFQCLNGECIPLHWVCDDSKDCSTGEDEHNCLFIHHCSQDEFVCRMVGNCISLNKVCNGVKDCVDGTDEKFCAEIDDKNIKPEAPSCAVGSYSCDNVECYPLSTICDGNRDCRDGYDETNCTGKVRIYQVLQMGVDERNINESSLLLYWWISTPNRTLIEFLPSISKLGTNNFKNQTWTSHANYLFSNLETYTVYNMTVYVRLTGTTEVFPPAKYFIARTGEGVPSEPWNVTVQQRNGSHILISWNQPVTPNGILTNYEISWYPPLPPHKLKLSDNSTAHLLAADFQPNTNYSFFVVAFNGAYESKTSKVASIVFDAESDVGYITDLQVVSKTASEVTLTWNYDKAYDGFLIDVSAKQPYPKLLPRLSHDRNVTVTNLAPGTYYTFEVSAFRKIFKSPSAVISQITSGIPLSVINTLDASVSKYVGTTVNLKWEAPKDHRKLNWTYGVYYGLTVDETLEKPRYNTTDLSATISNLHACEAYIFTVGIIGPIGVGPLSLRVDFMTTYIHPTAPPKKLKVTQGNQSPTSILIQWSAPCNTIHEPIGYIITAKEKITKQEFSITLEHTKDVELSHTATGSYGGIYEITVSTQDPNAIKTAPVIYNAPPIKQPIEFVVLSMDNGSYEISWLHKVPPEGGPYYYQLLVSEGTSLNLDAVQIIEVSKPPVIYTNSTSNTYSFAARIMTKAGYKSALSEIESIGHLTVVEASSISETSFVAIIVPIVVLLLVLSAALTVFYVRYRHLHNRFTRFGNSHYDSRSDAATFDDDTLEEDDSPQIQGFSADEPLVIA